MSRIVPLIAIGLVLAVTLAVSALGSGNGVRVTVTSSPSCPVERVPPDPACAPKPVDASVRVVSRKTHKTVARGRTGSDGKLTIRLRAASYTVYAHPASGATLPRCPSARATVRNGHFTRVAISCDSGIR